MRRLKDATDEASKKRLRDLEYEFENRIKTLKLCFQNKVKLIAGTDSIWEFGDYHLVLKIMVEAGIPALNVLRIATIDTAEALRLEDKIGTVEPEKYADLVGFSDNPIVNIDCIGKPCFAMKNGDIVLRH